MEANDFVKIGYEDEAPEQYYDRSYDEDYSPSPPHASGGSRFYPGEPSFPPTPQAGPTPGISQHDYPSTPHVEMPPIPPYNPQDYPPPPPQVNSYGYPPGPTRGNNVSTNDSTLSPGGTRDLPTEEQARRTSNLPYFPPPPTTPFVESIERTVVEEGALPELP